jgi:hypothetical protein
MKIKYKSGLSTIYKIKCYDSAHNLKWFDGFSNIVVMSGLNKLLDATFVSGLILPKWYIGLKNSSMGYFLSDTMSSHSGWTESTKYSEIYRQQFIPGMIYEGSIDNSDSPAIFHINDDEVIYGAFLVSDKTKLGTIGTLYGVGDFIRPHQVVSGDILEITIYIIQEN